MSEDEKETVMKIEMINTLFQCREALQEAILLAPLDKVPGRAGLALRDVNYMLDKYRGM